MQNVLGEGDFEHYQGVWRMQALPNCAPDGGNASRLTYAVEIKPKGILPVKLIEGRIASDLKANMAAIRRYVEAAEKLKPPRVPVVVEVEAVVVEAVEVVAVVDSISQQGDSNSRSEATLGRAESSEVEEEEEKDNFFSSFTRLFVGSRSTKMSVPVPSPEVTVKAEIERGVSGKGVTGKEKVEKVEGIEEVFESACITQQRVEDIVSVAPAVGLSAMNAKKDGDNGVSRENNSTMPKEEDSSAITAKDTLDEIVNKVAAKAIDPPLHSSSAFLPLPFDLPDLSVPPLPNPTEPTDAVVLIVENNRLRERVAYLEREMEKANVVLRKIEVLSKLD